MGRKNLLNCIRFDEWDPEKVAAWLRGLDDVMLPYAHYFLNNGIDGKKLFMLSHYDLEKLNVTKIGHQELILESVGLLSALRYGFETENLQSLALQLSVKARSLVAELKKQNMEEESNKNIGSNKRESHRQTPTVSVLTAVCDIISSLKPIITWLDRSPFEGMYELRIFRKSIVKIGIELLDYSLTSLSNKAKIQPSENGLVKSCTRLTTLCDEIVINSRDPLEFQPASLELATITKKLGETIGLHIVSYYGIHVIGDIKDLSPAQLSGKIMKGDEVIQVNNQTVVGWQLKKLVSNVKEKPKEVVLLLKKRPHHTNPYGHIPNRRKISNKQQTSTLPKSLKKRRCREEEKTSRSSFQEYVSSSVATELFSPKDGNETDNEVFRSGSESPQFKIEVESKPRRATVSGGSPTLARPSFVIEDLDTPTKESSPTISPDDMSEELKDHDCKDEKEESHDTLLIREVKSEKPPKYRHSTSDLPPSKFKDVTAEIPLENLSCTIVTSQDKDPIPSEINQGSNNYSNNICSTPSTPVSQGRQSESSPPQSTNPSSSNSTPTETSSILESFHRPLRETKSYQISDESSPKRRVFDFNLRKHSLPVESQGHEELVIDANSQELIIRSADLTRHKRIYSLPVGQSVMQSNLIGSSVDPLPQQLSSADSAVFLPSVHSSDHTENTSRQFYQNKTKEDYPTYHTHVTSERTSRSNSEVASDDKNTPTLMKITRLNSIGGKIDLKDEAKNEDKLPKSTVKRVDFDPSTREKLEEPTSYVCTVVGGVAHMIPMDKSTTVEVVRRRPKKRIPADRRISCKDLGKGDCEGWLYKKKQSAGPLGKNWKKRWCVLKDSNMFHYKRNDDLKAEGVIHLPAFKVSPATEMKSKKFAFKVHNAGTTFYFASERQDDMSKWMNKMGLAAISYDMSKVNPTAAGVVKQEPVNPTLLNQTATDYYSESEDENDDSNFTHYDFPENLELKDSDSSNDDLKELYRQLEKKDLTICGTDRNQRRRSHIQSSDMKMSISDKHLDKKKRICLLKRMLKDKEIELQCIDNLLCDINSSQLQEFREMYGSIQYLG